MNLALLAPSPQSGGLHVGLGVGLTGEAGLILYRATLLLASDDLGSIHLCILDEINQPHSKSCS